MRKRGQKVGRKPGGYEGQEAERWKGFKMKSERDRRRKGRKR